MNDMGYPYMPYTSCANCKSELFDDLPTTEQTHSPCPHCGSTSRTYFESLSDSAVMLDGHKAWVKRPSLPSAMKLRSKTYSGVEYNHQKGKLVRVHRTIDKDNDRYIERVVDMQTEEVLHECDEPLSRHTNHGTAKKKTKV
jgi:DNA-directed RNA polymerase subunit RPC12/RpoP